MDVGKKKELYSLHSLLGFLAMGKTGGNPPVSAVLTNGKGDVLEKAHTKEFGGNHAERELFSLFEKKHTRSLTEPNLSLSDSILSVSLEPCTHFGKTPPCRDLVLEYQPKELLLGWKDPNPLITSGDWSSYKEKGIQVRLDPVLANTSLPFLQGFLKRMKTGSPWVWIKVATSKEGNYTSSDYQKERISGEDSDLYLQMLRGKFDAVAVGPNTTKIDEPSLHFRITDSMMAKVGIPKRITSLIPFFDAATNLFFALTQWGKESVATHQLEEEKYQPYRVFVLDSKTLPNESFWKKQEELTERYGKKLCLFFLLNTEFCVSHVLPDPIKTKIETLSLHPVFPINKSDGNLFLQTLGKIGINTVLCEAGSFFPNFLENELTDEDCILEIRNMEKSIPDGIPFLYQNEPIHSEFAIGSNSIFIRKPKRRI
ncbi:dihydrofolate reductase family protein [Leptospira levettii]|uniref:Riboflavin biosynthesis protein RibD n=1 Tax=Leptospira levettii TaxID=2023178 RepID=A0ABY2MK22_9LEPT|nr:dihydrofolate reductase family protein [Leptospira levettii]TGL67215.1 deaminase [Leptospira levettii]